MSTRCLLRFTKEGTNRVAQVYRHSDGYPGSVIPTLNHLQRLLQATGAQRDPTYAAADFLFVDKLRSLERTFQTKNNLYEDYPKTVPDVLTVEAWKNCSSTPLYFLGHGVEDPRAGIHGDEEYLYQVELPEGYRGDWRVKIAGREQFPRWGEEEDRRHAFEMAEWRYDGAMEEALSEVQRDE
jgi:hypothetical protein